MNMRSNNFRIVAISLLLVGCSQGEQPEAQAPNLLEEASVATIDGQPIYTSLFERYAITRLQKASEDLSDNERSALIEELIQFYLMANAAEDAGISQEQDVVVNFELQRLQTLSRLVASRHLEANPPSETELQIAYEQNGERLAGVQYTARHILLDSEDEATAVIEELGAGADFQELAIARSTGPSGPNGGDLGWFSADTMVPPFAQAVSSMEVGTFSETPVQTRFGWHVILLEDTVDQEPPGLDAVRADITGVVEQRKIEEYLNSLRDTAVVIVEESTTAP